MCRVQQSSSLWWDWDISRKYAAQSLLVGCCAGLVQNKDKYCDDGAFVVRLRTLYWSFSNFHPPSADSSLLCATHSRKALEYQLHVLVVMAPKGSIPWLLGTCRVTFCDTPSHNPVAKGFWGGGAGTIFWDGGHCFVGDGTIPMYHEMNNLWTWDEKNTVILLVYPGTLGAKRGHFYCIHCTSMAGLLQLQCHVLDNSWCGGTADRLWYTHWRVCLPKWGPIPKHCSALPLT